MILFITNLFIFALIFWKISDKPLNVEVLKSRDSLKLGNALFEQLMILGSLGHRGKNNIELKRYKFFTKIVDSLMTSSVQYGTSVHEYLPKIKKALVSDLRFEKKLKNELLGGLFQMATVQVFSFIFVMCLFYQLNIRFRIIDLWFPLCLQAAGYILLVTLFYVIKKRTFSSVERYIETFYLVSSLLFARLPLGKIHEQCKIDLLPSKRDLNIFKSRLSIIFQEIKRTGTIQDQEIDISIEELWFLVEYKFDTFLKHLAALKLVIIVFFFLSSFMVILMDVLSTLKL